MARRLPEWMTDPAKFAQVLRGIAGKPHAGLLREEIADLKSKVASMQKPQQENPEPTTTTTTTTTTPNLPAHFGPFIIKNADVEPPLAIIKAEPAMIEKKAKEELPTDVAQLLTQMASLSQLAEIKKKLEKEEFKGRLDPRALSATDSLQWIDLVEAPPPYPLDNRLLHKRRAGQR